MATVLGVDSMGSGHPLPDAATAAVVEVMAMAILWFIGRIEVVGVVLVVVVALV